jgi:hypothetical protein
MNTRNNPDSEDNARMTKDNERAVFAAKMAAQQRVKEWDDDFWVIKGMKAYGGDFAKALAEACLRADDSNRERIKDAFPELWAKYYSFGKILKEKEHEQNQRQQKAPARTGANKLKT